MNIDLLVKLDFDVNKNVNNILKGSDNNLLNELNLVLEDKILFNRLKNILMVSNNLCLPSSINTSLLKLCFNLEYNKVFSNSYFYVVKNNRSNDYYYLSSTIVYNLSKGEVYVDCLNNINFCDIKEYTYTTDILYNYINNLLTCKNYLIVSKDSTDFRRLTRLFYLINSKEDELKFNLNNVKLCIKNNLLHIEILNDKFIFSTNGLFNVNLNVAIYKRNSSNKSLNGYLSFLRDFFEDKCSNNELVLLMYLLNTSLNLTFLIKDDLGNNL